MANPRGSPIWYELSTSDPDGAKRFYDAVVGWTIQADRSGEMDYRMISAPGGFVGGVLRLTAEMQAAGARPSWVMYLGVDDVDAAAAQARSLGGSILVPPTDIAGVGRFSLLADPQGALFYVMRAASDMTSTVFARGVAGRCGWHELCTTDVTGALAFYGAMFGWDNRETMDMGPAGGYHFLDLGSVRLGGAMRMPDRRAHWNMYFTVADMDAALVRVSAGGGAIVMGPQVVPTGERVVLGTDPQGAVFALVSPAGG